MWHFPFAFLNGSNEKNTLVLKVIILIALTCSAILSYINSPSPEQFAMSNEIGTDGMFKNDSFEISDHIMSSVEVAASNNSYLLEADGQMISKEWCKRGNVKSNVISATVGSMDESYNTSETTPRQLNTVWSLREDHHRVNEESTAVVGLEDVITCENQDLKICSTLSLGRNASVTFKEVDSGSTIFQNASFQESTDDGSKKQTLTNDSESEDEYEDAVDLRDNFTLFDISKTDSNVSGQVNTVGSESKGHNLLVVDNGENENQIENKIDSESDEEYEDAVESEAGPVFHSSSKINEDVFETIDTYMSVRHLGSLTQGEFSFDPKSDNVYIGNVSYDLGKVNLKQNMRMVQQLVIPQDTASTSQESVEFRMVTREEWQAERPMNVLTPLKKPVRLVIVSHTAASPFYTFDENVKEVRYIQRYHMVDQEWDDIGYNFLIGMDGSVFEGRGWDVAGAHTKYYNAFSIGVSFIGKFIFGLPTDVALQAFHTLMMKGVAFGHLAPDYKLHGACQLRPTLSPGEALYKEIMQWPHWAPVEEKQ